MTAWSDYLREQAIIADGVARTTTDPQTNKEFEDIAASYRHDADIEDATPTPDGNCPPPSEVQRQRSSQAALIRHR
jgi:hypothetical protein